MNTDYKFRECPLKRSTTIVVFRKWRKQIDENQGIVALFPYEIDNTSKGYVSSYEHIGQHSGADYQGCMLNTVPALANEYDALKRELESLGYDLQVIQRYSRKRYLDKLYEAIQKEG